MRKNVASQVICAQLNSKTDGSAVTSGTTTVYVTGDGGTQGAGSGTVTHEGQGCWSYVPAQAETNYTHVAFTFVNSTAVSQTVQAYTIDSFVELIFKFDLSTITGEASRSLLNAIRFLRNKWSISGTTLTVTKEDDSTAAWQSTLTTNAAADPITASDPS